MPRKLKFTAPLKWRRVTVDWPWWQTETPFGTMSVEQRDGKWSWRYCFDEYYNEDKGSCGSLAEGKAYLQHHWDTLLQDVYKSVRPL